MPNATDVKPIATEPDANVVCFVCPHPWDAHDPIAIRFCTATAAAGHHRACVCSSGATGGGGVYNALSLSR
ncbi:RGCVC family protein [Kibdelosporangium aridum]|uniref:RGCVC family protein n=1 Tax=Kibdelosporangium aridum TaxID=2030 RepID=UPI0035E691B8